MSVDFDRLAHERRSRSDIDDFLDIPLHGAEVRAEAIAERTLSHYQSHKKPLSKVAVAQTGTRNHALYESAGNLGAIMNIWLGEAAFLKGGNDTKNTFNVTEIRYLRDMLAHASYSVESSSSDEPENLTQAAPVARNSSSVSVVSLSRMHAFMWVVLILFALVWGIAAGAAFFAGAGVSPSVATFGVLGTMSLAATLFVLSTQNSIRKNGE